jgi:glycosyltransferase involved in cell wall biosynthesis
MRILVFSPFYPPHIGGLESHSDEFNRHLSSRGVTITVYTPHLPTVSPASETRHTDVTILRFPAFEAIHNYPVPKFWLPRFWRQWYALSQTEYDVIVSRTRFFFPSLMALWYAFRHDTPLLHIEHGSDFAHFNGRLKTLIGKIYDIVFGTFILCRADALVANSQASAAFVQTLSGRTDCQVIYRGSRIDTIEHCVSRPDLAKQFQNKTIIAFIGRLIDGKGTHDLITAVSLLRRDTIVTFIIGGGPEELRLKTMVRDLHLTEQVLFFGNLPFEEAISILKVAHICVNPSYTEGLPTSVTEAALCRKAIIATQVGGTPEVISGKGDGYLIPPRDIDYLKEKLLDLIDHPEKRIAFGNAAYQKVSGQFSWNHAGSQYLSVLNHLIHKKK